MSRPTPTIGFLHTAAVHVATFDALLNEMAPGISTVHRVEEDWLAEARKTGLMPNLEARIRDALTSFDGADAVICTCSTLGPVADKLSQQCPHIFRVDRPLMRRAVELGPRVLVAMCLESTRQPTLALLREAGEEVDTDVKPQVLICDEAWPHFEAGDTARFADAIAASIRREMTQVPADSVVLAQASMAVAEGGLSDLGVPVLSSPRLAVAHALELARH